MAIWKISTIQFGDSYWSNIILGGLKICKDILKRSVRPAVQQISIVDKRRNSTCPGGAMIVMEDHGGQLGQFRKHGEFYGHQQHHTGREWFRRCDKWWFTESGNTPKYPKSSIWVWFFLINHPFWATFIYLNPQLAMIDFRFCRRFCRPHRTQPPAEERTCWMQNS